jgi:hypothetical protein
MLLGKNMDINSWELYYKIHETEHRFTTTQMCYEPRVSPKKDVFCMNFCYPCDYQSNQPRLSYTKDLVDLMFEREVKYLNLFQKQPWAPEVIDITGKKIFIKWYGKTCNESIYRDNDLNKNWYDDLRNIILNQVNMGYLKATVYPHSHYYDNNGQMKTFDFYATVKKADSFISYELLKGLIGLDTNRFNEATVDKKINVEELFKSGLLSYSKWPVNLTEIYNEIYETK